MPWNVDPKGDVELWLEPDPEARPPTQTESKESIMTGHELPGLAVLAGVLVCLPVVSVELTPRFDATFEGVTVTMAAYESVTKGYGRDMPNTSTHTLHSEAHQMCGVRRLKRGEAFRLEHVLTVPEDAPPSFNASHNELYWKVEVVVDVRGWVGLGTIRCLWVRG